MALNITHVPLSCQIEALSRSLKSQRDHMLVNKICLVPNNDDWYVMVIVLINLPNPLYKV